MCVYIYIYVHHVTFFEPPRSSVADHAAVWPDCYLIICLINTPVMHVLYIYVFVITDLCIYISYYYSFDDYGYYYYYHY